MAQVEFRNVTKGWGSVVAVDNLSLTIADREFLALLGPSGCGKTTALRMIAGLEDPTSGDILIGERKVTYDLPKDRNVAMVFQNYGLYPHMTVASNIGYPLRVRKMSAEDIKSKVKQAADKARIGELLDRKPRELSGGQRQRVALARAIVRQPQAFLMDEPLSNLDAQLRASMRAELQHLSRELQVTTVYVTHDQAEAMTLANRVAVMNAGRIRQLGSPEDIYNNPADVFVAGFIGSPPMNLLRGEVRDNAFAVAGLRLPGLSFANKANLILGVRPEDAQVADAGAGTCDARVYAYEKTGDSTLVTVEIEGERFIAKGDRDLRPTIGNSVGLKLDANRCCFFDGENGKRLDIA